MDAARSISANPLALPPALPKFHALVDYGRGLYAGFDIHSQTLAETVARTKTAKLLLADGYQYEVLDGRATNPQPYAARHDNRFVWTPLPHA